MAEREIAVKTYVVKLSDEERKRLEALIHEFDTGVFSRELPVGFGVAFVSMALPGRDFFLEGPFVGDAAAQAPGGQNCKFRLGHVG